MINILHNKLNYLTLLQMTNTDAYDKLTSKKRQRNSNLDLDLDADNIHTHFKNAFLSTSIPIITNDMNENKRIYVKYARVSTKIQMNNDSITSQLNDISTYLNNKNIDESQQYIISEYDSAWSNIPMILKMMLLYLKNITICFAEYSRFNRHVDIFIQQIKPLLIKNNIKLLFISDEKLFHFNTENVELNCLKLIDKLIPCQMESEYKSIRMKKFKRRKHS